MKFIVPHSFYWRPTAILRRKRKDEGTRAQPAEPPRALSGGLARIACLASMHLVCEVAGAFDCIGVGIDLRHMTEG